MIAKLKIILEMIKFEHTIFALPFAFASAIVVAQGIPSLGIIGWIVLAMVGARSAAMAFNRIADAKIDALNPRTASRALPNGLISSQAAWVFTIIASALLIFAAYNLNRLAFVLSPVALFAILVYSYTKRFTSLSHMWLGLCLGIAPVGAWIAVTGRLDFAPMVLSAAVIFWTAGFDTIYSMQDVDFDSKMGLFSLPSKIGVRCALIVSRLLHALMIALLVWFGLICKMGVVYFCGVGFVALFLAYEQSLVSATDISRVNTAFFTMNGFVSIAFFLFVAVDVLL